jgi:hypothetical protein
MRARGSDEMPRPEIGYQVSGEKKRKPPGIEERVFGKWLRKFMRARMIDNADLP